MNASAATFIDSNILIYGFDAADRLKRDRATLVVSEIVQRGNGCISTQVMGEVYYNLTKLSKIAMPHAEAAEVVDEMARGYPVFHVLPEVMLDAVRLKNAHVLHFWDAVILATAKANGVATIISEDQTNRRIIEGIRYLNPFEDGFDLRDLS